MIHCIRHSFYLILCISLFSCKNSKEAQYRETLQYSFNEQGMSVAWTAFKFTAKIRVKGVFDDFKFKTASHPGSIETLLTSSKILINTQSVNSKSEIRDAKLRNIFFKTFNTNTINSELLYAYSGHGILVLTMNNITNEVDYVYNLRADTLVISSDLDLTRWKGEKALDTLNYECYELHKGTDGMSILWPNVSVLIKIPVIKY